MNILIVDDSKSMRTIVKRALAAAGYGAYGVAEAANGREALDHIRAARPAFVLCDWNMPEMTGIELLTALTSESISVPFAFVTSEMTADMRDRAKAAGALFLLAKPFTPAAMTAALSPVLPQVP